MIPLAVIAGNVVRLLVKYQGPVKAALASLKRRGLDSITMEMFKDGLVASGGWEKVRNAFGEICQTLGF